VELKVRAHASLFVTFTTSMRLGRKGLVPPSGIGAVSPFLIVSPSPLNTGAIHSLVSELSAEVCRMRKKQKVKMLRVQTDPVPPTSSENVA